MAGAGISATPRTVRAHGSDEKTGSIPNWLLAGPTRRRRLPPSAARGVVHPLCFNRHLVR